MRVGVLVPVAIGAQVAMQPGHVVHHRHLALDVILQGIFPGHGLGRGGGIINHRQRAPGEGHGIELAVLADGIDIEEFREHVGDARHLALVDGFDEIGGNQDRHMAEIDGDEINLAGAARLQPRDHLFVGVDVGGGKGDLVVLEEGANLQGLVIALPADPVYGRIGKAGRSAQGEAAARRGKGHQELPPVEAGKAGKIVFMNAHCFLPGLRFQFGGQLLAAMLQKNFSGIAAQPRRSPWPLRRTC